MHATEEDKQLFVQKFQAPNLLDHDLGDGPGDRPTGQILKASGKFENTLIWFLSDNGGHRERIDQPALGRTQGNKIEGGTQVPFFGIGPSDSRN